MKIKKREQEENTEINEYSRPIKKLKKEEEEEKGILFKYPLHILEEELFKNQEAENQNTFLSKDHKTWIKIIDLPELIETSDYLKFIDNLQKSIGNSFSSSCSSSSSNMKSYSELLKFNNSKKKSNSERQRRIPNIKYDIDSYKEIRDTLFFDIYLIERMSLYFQKYDIQFHHFVLTENKNEYINSKELYSNLIKQKEEHSAMTFILSYGARRCLKIRPIKKNDDHYFGVDYYIGHYDIIVLSPDFHKTHTLTTNGKKSVISNSIDDNKNLFGETSFYMSFV